MSSVDIVGFYHVVGLLSQLSGCYETTLNPVAGMDKSAQHDIVLGL